jgi:uncharacterized protein YrzB (UPF0473 family)
MKNNLCKKLEYYNKDGFNYIDYTNMGKIAKVPEKFEDQKYWEYLSVQTGTRFENLSYIYYGTTDYWDILMSFNNIISLFDLPQNEDVIYKLAKVKFDSWYEDFMLLHRISQEEKDLFDSWYTVNRFSTSTTNEVLFKKLLEIETQMLEENEKNRIIRFIKREYIVDVLKAI